MGEESAARSASAATLTKQDTMRRSAEEAEKWALLCELRVHRETRLQLQRKAEQLMAEAAKVTDRSAAWGSGVWKQCVGFMATGCGAWQRYIEAWCRVCGNRVWCMAALYRSMV